MKAARNILDRLEYMNGSTDIKRNIKQTKPIMNYKHQEDVDGHDHLRPKGTRLIKKKNDNVFVFSG